MSVQVESGSLPDITKKRVSAEPCQKLTLSGTVWEDCLNKGCSQTAFSATNCFSDYTPKLNVRACSVPSNTVFLFCVCFQIKFDEYSALL